MDFRKIEKDLCGEIWTGDEMIDLLTFITDMENRFAGSAEEKRQNPFQYPVFSLQHFTERNRRKAL